ncbi:MAG TPA: hypothetical protein VE994_08940 [Terriglobales bacterium]|nr:hypothetical protein [Terriglobales bacterium]
MKVRRLPLAIAFSVLLLAATAFSTGRKVAVFPTSATVNVNGPTTSVDLEAFCNQTPCNIQWAIVLSGANVGSINNQTGPTTTFSAGTATGTALVIANDGMGNMAHASVTVLQ